MSLPRRPSFSSGPKASVPRMILSPFLRLARRLSPVGLPSTIPTSPAPIILAVTAALQRLDLSTDPRQTLRRLQQHRFTLLNTLPQLVMFSCALFCLIIMSAPIAFRIALPVLYVIALLLPITSQFVFPATPVLAWVLQFFSARYIPSQHRPNIHVNVLPALESVLYGANISDLQTRYTHPLLDVLAWLPYGVLHFALPAIVAVLLWVFGPKGAVQYWGKAFGWMNLLGVLTQLLFPCAAPWYEIIHGLTPANYAMPGSPGGLLRIDRVFHSKGYTNTFGNAPLVFGAFPSLHSGCAVMESLFMAHFFPRFKVVYWTYTGILWWATMYLSHHYLIDLTGGACLSVMVFYVTMPGMFKDVDQIDWAAGANLQAGTGVGASSTLGGVVGGAQAYELLVDPGTPTRDEAFEADLRRLEEEVNEGDVELGKGKGSTKENGVSIDGDDAAGVSAARLGKKRSVSWGETKVLGEEDGDLGVSAEKGAGGGAGAGSSAGGSR